MLRRLLRRFGADNRGNMAIMFGFLVIPLIGAAGLSIDYGRATFTRSSLQNAIDATALMLSRDLKKNPNMSATDVQTRGQQYFNAQFNPRFSVTTTVTTTYQNAATQADGLSKVNITATANVDTTLMRIVGSNGVRVASDAQIVWGIKRLEVSLVLDNSGSMQQDSTGRTNLTNNKMIELKKATRTLLTFLQNAAVKLEDIKVSVVPFTAAVNVGASNYNASWIDWTNWDNTNRTYGCSGSGSNRVCGYTPNNHATWNGCIQDRTISNDATDVAPTTTATRFPAYQSYDGSVFECSPAAVLPLTDLKVSGSWTDEDLNMPAATRSSVLGKAVAAMTYGGATNNAIGTAWGWHSLTKSEPLTQGRDPMPDTDKIIILLTDGINTAIRTSGNGSSACSACDTRFLQTCTNAKAAGVIIYTVALLVDDAEATLRACASGPEYFETVNNASQLSATFVKIGQSLTNLRIAK
jgi:Flp pilus assembly protein TadG